MKKRNLTINSRDIENIITKFYFKGEELHFQIIFNLASKESVLYEDFEDYLEYRQKFRDVIMLKNRAESILVKDAVILQGYSIASD